MKSLISGDIISDIRVPDISDLDFSLKIDKKNIFSINQRKGWNSDSTDEARCDFAPNKVRISPRSGLWFISLWKKSVKGRTLKDIKADGEMVGFFAENVAEIIRQVVGDFLSKSDFAIVTTPPRRHKIGNFAESAAKRIADILGIVFYSECATARSKGRVGAVFDANNIPAERNIIVFDDIVTTGQTMAAMHALLKDHGKNCLFFAGINNAS